MKPVSDPAPTFDIVSVRASLSGRLQSASHRRDKSKLVAAALFFDHGVYPSASIVRSITTHGSLTDIQADLRQFWEELRSNASKEVSIPGIPESLVAVAGPTLQALWVKAVEAANDGLAAVQREAADSIEAANERAAADRARLDEARSHIEVQATVIEQGRAALLDAQRQVGSLEAETAASAQATEQLRAQLVESETRHGQLQAVLAEGLDGLKKSTDKASDAFRGEINYLKMQLDAARGAERDLREQLQNARQGRETELQVLRQQNNGLLESNGRLTLTNQELLQRLGVVTK